MPDLIGSSLGPYRILEQIGLGGMATVYKAYQPGMDRLVALKVLPQHYARDPRFVKRFEQEAKVIAKLEHRNIVPIYGFGNEGGTAYLVMRYLQAGTVKDILSHGPLPLADAAKLLNDVASALDYAHSQGIVHRDVKPSNVLIDKHGNVFLTDFGIAKVLEGTTELTGSAALGTPAYMSPEQTLGRPVTPQSDVYSLGVMLYELVTGKQPFEADTPMAIALMHVHEPLPLPRKVKPDLPEAVELIILKALAKDVKERFASAGELARAFAHAVGNESAVAPARLIELANAAVANLGSEDVTYDVRAEVDRYKRVERMQGVRRWLPWAVGLGLILVLTLSAVWLSGQVSAVQIESQQTGTAIAVNNLTATSSAHPKSNTPTLTLTPTPSLTPTATSFLAAIQTVQAGTANAIASQPALQTDIAATRAMVNTHVFATQQVLASMTAAQAAQNNYNWVLDRTQINHVFFNATGCTYNTMRVGEVVFHITVKIWDSEEAARAAVIENWPIINIDNRGRPWNRYALGPTQDPATGQWGYEYIAVAEADMAFAVGTHTMDATWNGGSAQCTIVVN